MFLQRRTSLLVVRTSLLFCFALPPLEVIAIDDDDAELDPVDDPRFWTDRQPDPPYEEPSPLTHLDDDDSMSVDLEADQIDQNPWPGIPSDTAAHPTHRMMQPVHRQDLQVSLAKLNLHMLCLIIARSNI